MKRIINIFVLFILMSCKSDNLNNFKGHWHQVVPDSFCYYSTVDIYNDIVVFNKNCLNGFYSETKLFKDGFLYFIPQNTSQFMGKLEIKNDTLFITDNGEFSSKSVWIKSNFNCRDVNYDISSNLNININLKPVLCPIVFDSVFPRSFAIINIGKIKSCSFASKFIRDSFYVQLGSSFHNLNMVKPFLESEREAWFDDSLVNLSIILNVDNETPDNILDEIFEQVNRLDYVKKIYQTCLDTINCSIGFVEIR